MIRNVLTARVGNLICQVPHSCTRSPTQVYVNLRPSALSLKAVIIIVIIIIIIIIIIIVVVFRFPGCFFFGSVFQVNKY